MKLVEPVGSIVHLTCPVGKPIAVRNSRSRTKWSARKAHKALEELGNSVTLDIFGIQKNVIWTMLVLHCIQTPMQSSLHCMVRKCSVSTLSTSRRQAFISTPQREVPDMYQQLDMSAFLTFTAKHLPSLP